MALFETNFNLQKQTIKGKKLAKRDNIETITQY